MRCKTCLYEKTALDLIFPICFWQLETRMSLNRGSSQSIRGFDLEGYLARRTAAVDQALRGLLPPANTKPATIHKAMRYSLFAGGKRLRPALCLAAAEACGGSIAPAMPLACALECIHTYSLIHDDLPAMDDDDLRRGKPTNHKVFGEGIAILAGDGLLTEAFAIAARCRGWPRYSTRAIILELAEAAGSRQLIAGQVADLEGEGKRLSAAQLKYIHERKTSALLCCSVRLGGMSANASAAQLRALTDFGYNVGLAFQIIDDILDVTQTSEQLGKTAGKDTAAEKATYPSIVGMEKSRAIAAQLTDRAFGALEFFKGKATALAALAEYLLKRDK
jgi:geranylgeranyl diphosphate synthase, type II